MAIKELSEMVAELSPFQITANPTNPAGLGIEMQPRAIAIDFKDSNAPPSPTLTRIESVNEPASNSNKDITNVIINLICLCSIVFAFANYLFVSGIDTVLTIIIGFFIPEIFITIIVPAVYCKRHPKVLPFVLKKIRKIFKQGDQALAVNVIGSNHGNPI